jgi:hypothetical protein
MPAGQRPPAEVLRLLEETVFRPAYTAAGEQLLNNIPRAIARIK